MSRKRVSIFEEDAEGLDVGGFAPKAAADTNAPRPEQVKAVAEAVRFVSRESAAVPPQPHAKRPARRYRTGRNVQFNVKALHETVEAVYAISEAKGWVLGYTLQRAIEALQRELKDPA